MFQEPLCKILHHQELNLSQKVAFQEKEGGREGRVFIFLYLLSKSEQKCGSQFHYLIHCPLYRIWYIIIEIIEEKNGCYIKYCVAFWNINCCRTFTDIKLVFWKLFKVQFEGSSTNRQILKKSWISVLASDLVPYMTMSVYLSIGYHIFNISVHSKDVQHCKMQYFLARTGLMSPTCCYRSVSAFWGIYTPSQILEGGEEFNPKYLSAPLP